MIEIVSAGVFATEMIEIEMDLNFFVMSEFRIKDDTRTKHENDIQGHLQFFFVSEMRPFMTQNRKN